VWVDSHCHLQLADGEEHIARARAAGVEWMVCVGTDLDSSLEAIEFGLALGDVYPTVGLHPHEASKFEAEREMIAALVQTDPTVVGIGECGFDFYYEHSPRDEQEAAFRWQIRVARDLGKALVIHSRDAWVDTFRVLDDEGVPPRTVFHCFTGGPDEARAALERGCFLSFSGIVSFKNADALREAAALAPADRILVETDSPYLAPEPYRGRENEPAYVVAVGEAVARARGVGADEIARVTRENAAHVFGVER
jgi:TatD DNase family protein